MSERRLQSSLINEHLYDGSSYNFIILCMRFLFTFLKVTVTSYARNRAIRIFGSNRMVW